MRADPHRRPGRGVAATRTALFAGLLAAVFAGSFADPAAAQPLVQVGSSSDRGSARNEWGLGVGYEFDFPALPFTVGALVQTGSGHPGPDGRMFPARAYATVKVGMLPTPGFRVYLGGGGGVSTRFGGGAESSPRASGMALAGFAVGRLHLEAQLQRDFGEAPVTRWVTVIGLSF